MSTTARGTSKIVRRLQSHDPSLKIISLSSQRRTNEELIELTNCLLENPDSVTNVSLDSNQLTDETGIKLACFLAASTTIQCLNLSLNQMGLATYLAIAAALRVNTSLKYLYLYKNEKMDDDCIYRIKKAFVEALTCNPDRPAESVWWLCETDDEFPRLKAAADRSRY